MKKIISILVSVMMILTAIPAFADTAAAAPASVDVYEALDNFSAQELATTYTSANPYIEGGFVAPAGINKPEYLNAKAYEDDDVGDYVRLVPTADANSSQSTVTAGAWIHNSNLNVGVNSGQRSGFTAEFKFRYNTSSRNLFLYLVDDAGANHFSLFKLWSTDRCDITNGNNDSYSNLSLSLSDNTWYEMKIVGDVVTGKLMFVVNGGNHINKVVYAQRATGASNVTYTGIRLGWATPLENSPNEYLDIANMSISNVASFEYDEKISLEHDTVSSTATPWINGNWKLGASSHATYWQPTSYYMGGIHKNVISLLASSANALKYPIWFVHTIPDGNVTSDGVLVVEGSYYEEDYAYMNIRLTGVKGDGTTTAFYPVANAKLGEWAIKCMNTTTDDDGNAMVMPRKGGWVTIRVTSDLKTDTLKLEYWQENDPTNTLVTATREGALADYESINGLRFEVYSAEGAHAYVDDLKVYTADTLRYTGSNPVNGGANAVSVTADPTLIFNMPVANYTGTMTLKDSDGNAVAGTVGINAQRNGVAYYPTVDLKEEETYTLDFEGTVIDAFGQTLAVDKTITFTTEPVLTLVDFEFSKDVVTAGELGATIEVKAKDKLARNIYAALAIYNKTTGELVSINTGSINAVTNTFNLTATVPAEGTYYAKAFVWNTDANAVPYFTAKSIGLN